ncbi:hypothetical protein ABZP36_015256 [Zizania latifolia]
MEKMRKEKCPSVSLASAIAGATLAKIRRCRPRQDPPMPSSPRSVGTVPTQIHRRRPHPDLSPPSPLPIQPDPPVSMLCLPPSTASCRVTRRRAATRRAVPPHVARRRAALSRVALPGAAPAHRAWHRLAPSCPTRRGLNLPCGGASRSARILASKEVLYFYSSSLYFFVRPLHLALINDCIAMFIHVI